MYLVRENSGDTEGNMMINELPDLFPEEEDDFEDEDWYEEEPCLKASDPRPSNSS